MAGISRFIEQHIGLHNPQLQEDCLPLRMILGGKPVEGLGQNPRKEQVFLGIQPQVHHLGHFSKHLAPGVLATAGRRRPATIARLRPRVIDEQLQMSIHADVGHERKGDRGQIALPAMVELGSEPLQAQIGRGQR